MRWPYPRIPPLGRHLPQKYIEGENVFDQRVRARFPIGSVECDMVNQLEIQGFSIDHGFDYEGWRSASIRRGIIIQTLWSVRWRATANRIEEVFGVYAAIAP